MSGDGHLQWKIEDGVLCTRKAEDERWNQHAIGAEIIQAIVLATQEKCAQVVEAFGGEDDLYERSIASAIRALKMETGK